MLLSLTSLNILLLASGNKSSFIIIQGVAPTAIAASIMPLSISRNEVSTIRAKNGIAATDSDTLAAVGPIAVPVIKLASGINATIKIINGMERIIFTINQRLALIGRFR